MSHLGRPKGLFNKKYSLAPVAQELQKLLKKKVHFLDNCIGKDVQKFCHGLENGEIVLLENLRFHPEETGKGEDKFGN